MSQVWVDKNPMFLIILIKQPKISFNTALIFWLSITKHYIFSSAEFKRNSSEIFELLNWIFDFYHGHRGRNDIDLPVLSHPITGFHFWIQHSKNDCRMAFKKFCQNSSIVKWMPFGFKLFFDVSQTVYGSPVTAGCNIWSGMPTKIK